MAMVCLLIDLLNGTGKPPAAISSAAGIAAGGWQHRRAGLSD
jgi:hypothetical protein